MILMKPRRITKSENYGLKQILSVSVMIVLINVYLKPIIYASI